MAIAQFTSQQMPARRMFFTLLLAAGLALASPFRGEAQQAKPAEAVHLTIDFGDGAQKVFPQLAWKEGLTVLAALEMAREHPRGVKLEYRGSGDTAFVTSIDELPNEGAGRNWLYAVNGKPADKSCGAWVLKTGDRVVWRFAVRQE